jgi:hypothetical protein
MPIKFSKIKHAREFCKFKKYIFTLPNDEAIKVMRRKFVKDLSIFKNSVRKAAIVNE